MRSYGDRCGIARALDLVGERWALLVVRELLLGPKRFTDLRAGLPGVSADILAQRLRELEGAGLVRRASLPPPAASRVYELTERGTGLEPVLLELGRWGSATPLPDAAVFGPDSVVLGMKSLFAAGRGVELAVVLRLREDVFTVRVDEGLLAVARGEGEGADAVIACEPRVLAGMLWHGTSLEDALSAGSVTTEGSRRAVALFLGLFAL
jgi:DNA-binding HxlR family transcriptional regulator